MRYVVVNENVGVRGEPNSNAPATVRLGPGDQVEGSVDAGNPDWVKGQVIGPQPQATGWVRLKSPSGDVNLKPFEPSADIEQREFYRFLQDRAIAFASDQRYLFALATALSGVKNDASVTPGSDAFGPFRYTTARWTELLQQCGPDVKAVPDEVEIKESDRQDPFKQATVAAVEARRMAASFQKELGRTAQRNELYVMHVLGDVGGLAVVTAAKTAPTTPAPAALATKMSQADADKLVASCPELLQVGGAPATVEQVLSAAATALDPGLAGTGTFEPFEPEEVPAATGATSGAGGTTAKQAFDILVGLGWSKAQTCGILGNIQAESNFKHTAVGDSGAAYGLCQWHPDRQAHFTEKFNVGIKSSSFEQQVQFIDAELRTLHWEKSAGDHLKNIQTEDQAGAAQAAEIVCREFERPGDKDGESRKRRGNAENWFRQFGEA